MLSAFLSGCASLEVVRVARTDSLNIPVSLENPPDSGDAIHHMWVSFAAPDFVVLHTTSSNLGPRRVEIGESWNAVGVFSISSAAPIGCTALAYAISTSSEDVTIPNYNDDSPTIIKLLINPEKKDVWHSVTELPRELVCAFKKLGPNTSWSWSTPPPAARVPPLRAVKRNHPLVPDPLPFAGLPRGDFGFVLGSSLRDADENAKSRGLWPVAGTNVSARPDEWRYFEVSRDPEISVITMFFRDGTLSQLNISHDANSKVTFDRLFERLRSKLGKESVLGRGESYWADGQTVVVLSGSQIRYYDLSRSVLMRFTRIGGGTSYNFIQGRGYVDGSGR